MRLIRPGGAVFAAAGGKQHDGHQCNHKDEAKDKVFAEHVVAPVLCFAHTEHRVTFYRMGLRAWGMAPSCASACSDTHTVRLHAHAPCPMQKFSALHSPQYGRSVLDFDKEAMAYLPGHSRLPMDHGSTNHTVIAVQGAIS
ncbi:MAG: hypothetical protein KDG51_08715 [Calditrichaeota bacterium]|nr:hypothetical protein [Calditrichota bacterium]